MLERLARFCYRRRGRVLVGWIVLLVAVNVVVGSLGSDYRADNSLPNSESQDVQELLEQSSPNRAGFQGQIVFRDEQGVSDLRVREEMESLFAEVDELAGVDVASPYAAGNGGQITDDGRIAFAEVQVSDRDYQDAIDLGNRIERLGKPHEIDGLTVEYGGEMFADFEMPESEALGLLAAAIILLIAFGSVIAMGLPIGTALFGLGTGVALDGAAQSRAVDARLRAATDRDDRSRCRNRLRALHRHPVPRRPTRRIRQRACPRASSRHVGPSRVVRRRDGDHLAARPLHHGVGVRVGPRDRGGARRRHDDGRGGDAAPGADRLRREPDRGHEIPRPPRFRERRVRACSSRCCLAKRRSCSSGSSGSS